MTSVWKVKIIKLEICEKGDKEHQVGEVKVEVIEDVTNFCLDWLDRS